MSQQVNKKMDDSPEAETNSIFASTQVQINYAALKKYWPILILSQMPLIGTYYFTHKKIAATRESLDLSQIYADLEKQQQQLEMSINSTQQQYETLNQKFEEADELNKKILKILSALKAAKKKSASEPAITNPNLIQKITLESLDKLGEKIRLGESFSGILITLPSDCFAFSGYKTLQHFSDKPPLTFARLKKSFEELAEHYTPTNDVRQLPEWLHKIASFFQGTIKIEKKQHNQTNTLQPALNALEGHDLKLAVSLAQDLQIPEISSWLNSASDHLVLESEFSIFAEEVKNWAKNNLQSKENSSVTRKEALL